MLINIIQHGELRTSTSFLTDRQRDRQTERQAKRQKKRQTDRETGKETDKETDKETEKETKKSELQNKSSPGCILDFSMSIARMLISMIQHGESRTSASFLTKAMILISFLTKAMILMSR
jgi:sRNA-binding protein